LTSPSSLTPDGLLSEFRKTIGDFGWLRGRRAIESFKAVEDKSAFLEPTIQFLKEEEEDQIRTWGTSVLELIGGERAFSSLVDMLRTEKTMREYLYTRFWALKACANLAKSDREQNELLTLLKHMWQDQDEDYLSQAEASILLARHEHSEAHLRQDAEAKVKDMLSEKRFGEYWPALRALRALREFPLPDLADDIILIIRKHPYLEHRAQAIQALGAYTDNLAVVRELGLIVRTNPDSDLRLKAVRSLARLRDPESQEDLVQALDDENGEVRIQASDALKSLLKGDAITAITQHALREGIEEESLAHLVDALRRIDRDRSTEALSKELSGEDRRRA
jgi:HEAT repeat protein